MTVYLYPMRSEDDMINGPYTSNLAQALSIHFDLVNLYQPRNSAFNLFRYLFKARLFYFNWPENAGRKETILLILFLIAAKIFRRKIIWTHHNRHPHHENRLSSRILMAFFNKLSDRIIIHTRESYSLLGKKNGAKQIIEFFHPFFSEPVSPSPHGKIEYDLLIWGNVRGSKGIDGFIRYLNESSSTSAIRIKIIGKFPNEQMYSELVKLNQNNGVSIENKFLSMQDLKYYHSVSRYIFFPYTGSSVLNSGALVTSLPFMTPVIGPNTGAFKELGEKKLIFTYEGFDEIMDIIRDHGLPCPDFKKRLESFINDHTWGEFGNILNEEILKISAK